MPVRKGQTSRSVTKLMLGPADQSCLIGWAPAWLLLGAHWHPKMGSGSICPFSQLLHCSEFTSWRVLPVTPVYFRMHKWAIIEKVLGIFCHLLQPLQHLHSGHHIVSAWCAPLTTQLCAPSHCNHRCLHEVSRMFCSKLPLPPFPHLDWDALLGSHPPTTTFPASETVLVPRTPKEFLLPAHSGSPFPSSFSLFLGLLHTLWQITGHPHVTMHQRGGLPEASTRS